MPYFSNGTEGEMWREANCLKGTGCAHDIQEPPGCPIMAVSFLFNYDQHKTMKRATVVDETAARANGVAEGIHTVLEALVPTGEDGFAQDCPFFCLPQEEPH